MAEVRASLDAGQRRAARLATQALTPAAELLAAGTPEHDRVLEALSAGDP